jgi:hypothetical protein
MSAHDNLSHQLFHGTIETLKPGDIIKPRTEHGTAWATSDIHYALNHTQDRVRSGFGMRDGGEYPVHHGNVYEVEPAEGDSYRNEPDKTIFTGNAFRVKSKVASVLGQKDNHDTIKRSFPEFDPSKESYVKNGRDGGRRI